MEFLDPKQKRAHTIRLYVGYALMATLIVAATYILSNLAFGTYYDIKTKTVIQNGLVFFDAHPESARVSVNGEDKGRTDVRLVLPSGKYDIELTSDGYRSWKHDLNLEASTIERLVYPFLFPSELKPKDAQLFGIQPTFASQSLDRRWLVVQHSNNINEFDVIDLNSENTEGTNIVLDSSLITQTGTKHQFSEVEWSTDNRHVLVKHAFDGGQEFLIIDRETPTASVNLSTRFKRAMTNVRLRDKKFDKYYLHDTATTELVAAELNNEQPVFIASNVITFQPHGKDILLYAAREKSSKQTSIILREGAQNYTLRQLPLSSKYVLDLAQFDGNWYVVAGAADDKKVFVYKNPFDDLKDKDTKEPLAFALLRLNQSVEQLSFSANTRFIAIQAGSTFAVYDAENNRQFRYDTKLKIPAKYKVKWMDGHRFNAVLDGKVHVFDFDGTNQQTLIAANNAYYPFFNRDYRKLFTISPSVTVKNKSALVLTPLEIEK